MAVDHSDAVVDIDWAAESERDSNWRNYPIHSCRIHRLVDRMPRVLEVSAVGTLEKGVLARHAHMTGHISIEFSDENDSLGTSTLDMHSRCSSEVIKQPVSHLHVSRQVGFRTQVFL